MADIAQYRGTPQQRTLRRWQPVDLARGEFLDSRGELVRVLTAGDRAGKLTQQQRMTTGAGGQRLGDRGRQWPFRRGHLCQLSR